MAICIKCGTYIGTNCHKSDGAERTKKLPSVVNRSLKCSKCLEPDDLDVSRGEGNCTIKLQNNCSVNLAFEFEVNSLSKD